MPFIKIICLLFMLSSSQAYAQDLTINYKLASKAKVYSIDVFKFYISNVELTFDDSSTFKEPNSYHLIDIKSGLKNFTLQNVPEGEIKLIQFTIGTDSIINVSGALDGDLDPIKGMYWAWNTGYINFKIEGSYSDKSFEYHVGGYMEPYTTARIVSFGVSRLKNKQLNILIDLSNFLNKFNISETISILTPGKRAFNMANEFKTVFSIDE